MNADGHDPHDKRENLRGFHKPVNGSWAIAGISFDCFLRIAVSRPTSKPRFEPAGSSESPVSTSSDDSNESNPIGGADSDSQSGRRWRLAVVRLTALVIAMIPLSLLGVAGALEPDSRGLGTHHQLGLPPCSVRLLFGFRCPGCGMTTSWAHFVRGQFAESVRVNIGGFLLAVFSLVVAFFALRTFWTAGLPSVRIQQAATLTLIAIALVTGVDWLTRLFG